MAWLAHDSDTMLDQLTSPPPSVKGHQKCGLLVFLFCCKEAKKRRGRYHCFSSPQQPPASVNDCLNLAYIDDEYTDMAYPSDGEPWGQSLSINSVGSSFAVPRKPPEPMLACCQGPAGVCFCQRCRGCASLRFHIVYTGLSPPTPVHQGTPPKGTKGTKGTTPRIVPAVGAEM